ncbi:MAG: hypothetical protein ACRCU2_29385 [Planktothrix sp.]
MNRFFIDTNKKDHLINCLTRGINSRMRLHLFLITCYFDPEAATEIIKSLSYLNIKKITLYLDKKQAIQRTITDLKIWQKTAQEICKKCVLEIYIVNQGALFHSKLYSLIRLNQKGELISGNLVITSANLTKPGWIDEHKYKNIESIFGISNLETIKQFYQELNSLKYVTLEELTEKKTFAGLEKFNKAKETSTVNNATEIIKPKLNSSLHFKYELLCCGKFLYKWNENLNSCLSIRYNLTLKAKAKSLQKEFSERGFNIEKATISKNYFDLTDEEKKHILDSNQNKQIDNLTKNYGIQTFLGYWIPKQFTSVLEERSNQYDTFADNLFKKLEEQLEGVCKNAQKDYLYLLEEELILPTNKGNFENDLTEKIENLRESTTKLQRIWNKYYLFDLPYNYIEDAEKIENLYDVLMETCKILKNKKISVRAVLNADIEEDLSHIIDLK